MHFRHALAQFMEISFCLLYFQIGSIEKRAAVWNTQRMRTPLPWGSEFHYPEDLLKTFLRLFRLRSAWTVKMIKHAILSHLHWEIQQTKWIFFFNPNILKNFLLGVGGFVFPNGDQKVPFQPHFRQNTRLFQDPEDPHSTTLMICQPPPPSINYASKMPLTGPYRPFFVFALIVQKLRRGFLYLCHDWSNASGNDFNLFPVPKIMLLDLRILKIGP